MACSTAPQFSFPRTSSSTSPSQILMGSATGQSTTSTASSQGALSAGRPNSANGPSSAVTVSAPPPSVVGGVSAATSASSGATAPPLSSRQSSPGSHHASGGGGGCCESGRPILTDPITGQTVCSCQYDAAQLIGYQRLAAAAANSTLPAGLSPSMYTAATAPYPASAAAAAAVAAQAAAAAEQGAYLPLTADQSAFYSPTANGFDLKENLEAWRSLAAYPSAMYYPYESPLAGYPFANGYGVDLNGARRKNATRETTSTLKAWLSEHRKNPYPTKGEKIMLAIITKMTLTQVSTWFANARRRLKKENKMTWEPRNRCDEDDDIADVDGNDNTDNLCNSGDEDVNKDDELDVGDHNSDLDCKDDGVLDVDDSTKCPSVREHPLMRLQTSSQQSGDGPKSSSTSSSSTSTTQSKPRIWSIVDTATSSANNSNKNSCTSIYSSTTSAKMLPHITRTRMDYAALPYPHPKHPGSSWYPGNPGVSNILANTTSVYSSNLQAHQLSSPELSASILSTSRIPASFPNGLIYQSARDRKSPTSLVLSDKHRQLLATSETTPHRLSSSTASVSSSPPSSPETKPSPDNV